MPASQWCRPATRSAAQRALRATAFRGKTDGSDNLTMVFFGLESSKGGWEEVMW